MSYNYEKHVWHNDAAPAINEKNLNEVEAGIAAAYTALNNIDNNVVWKEEGKGLSSNDLTDNLARWLTKLDTTYGDRYDEVGGLIPASVVEQKVDTVDKKVVEIENSIEKAASGQSDVFSKVAVTGSYNDLKDKLTAGENISIDSNNVISSTGGGGSKIPVQSDIPVQKEGEIWFRTFE